MHSTVQPGLDVVDPQARRCRPPGSTLSPPRLDIVADSAAILPRVLLYKADSAAILPVTPLLQADFAPILLFPTFLLQHFPCALQSVIYDGDPGTRRNKHTTAVTRFLGNALYMMIPSYILHIILCKVDCAKILARARTLARPTFNRIMYKIYHGIIMYRAFP